jgi:lipoprotein-anchoring transpeptidase ErfK/SrfK
VAVFIAWRFWPEETGSSGENAVAAADPVATGRDPAAGDDGRSGNDRGAMWQEPLGSPTERLMPPTDDDRPRRATMDEEDPPPTIEMGGTETIPATDRSSIAGSDDRTIPLIPRRAEPAPSRPDALIGQRADARLQSGMDMLARNELVEGRLLLSEALLAGRLNAEDRQWARDRLTELNQRMVFSPEIVPGDPFAMAYAIESGDALSRLPRKLGLQVDWRMIQQINRIALPHRIRVGQRVKLITGPFHAIVDKSDYRMDILLGEGREQVFVCSFPIGLGEYNSTPEGRFRVKRQSKLINPQWTNPRTRELYLPDDPDNPIGEHWIGLEGAEAHLEQVEGYGIHGTIEPNSIGQQASMGCVRMRADDIAIVYAMLMEGVSTVTIQP